MSNATIPASPAVTGDFTLVSRTDIDDTTIIVALDGHGRPWTCISNAEGWDRTITGTGQVIDSMLDPDLSDAVEAFFVFVGEEA